MKRIMEQAAEPSLLLSLTHTPVDPPQDATFKFSLSRFDKHNLAIFFLHLTLISYYFIERHHHGRFIIIILRN